jgi:hypothetical protein
VLGDIKRITAFAKHYEDEFLQILTASATDEVERQIGATEQKIAKLKARNKELDSLFERIYEDNASGKITDDRFAKMSAKYETEQTDNEKQIRQYSQEVHAAKSKSGTAKDFLATVKRYTRMRKLTPEILREFVDKIVVHHRQAGVRADHSRCGNLLSVHRVYRIAGHEPNRKRKPATGFRARNQQRPKNLKSGVIPRLTYKRIAIKDNHAPYGYSQWLTTSPLIEPHKSFSLAKFPNGVNTCREKLRRVSKQGIRYLLVSRKMLFLLGGRVNNPIHKLPLYGQSVGGGSIALL